MVDISGFNAAEVEPSTEYELLPEGKYHAEIIASEERDIGDGGAKGTKITFTWKIITGPCSERLIWQDILHAYKVRDGETDPKIIEKAGKTRDIASRQLSAVCHAVGKLAPATTEDLHHVPCEVSVGFQKQNKDANGNPYAPRNEVKGVKPWDQGAGRAAANGQRQAPAAQQQAASSGAPSGGGWNRRTG